jgi:hypothetical protein
MSKISEDGRVWDIGALSVTQTFIHPEYLLDAPSNATIGPTGRWCLFEVRHNNGVLLFRARWDEKDAALDIDRVTRDDKGEEKFTKNFTGHKTHQPDPNVRVFEVDINPASGRVFRGTVRFNLTRRIVLTARIKLGVTVSEVVTTRKTRRTKIFDYLSTTFQRFISLFSSK